MLLTVLWGSCLLLGRCDFKELEDGKLSTIDRTLTKPYDLTSKHTSPVYIVYIYVCVCRFQQ